MGDVKQVQDLNLTFSGCGFLGIYHLGVVTCLKENAPLLLKRVKCFGGASAGAFAAVALVLGVPLNDIAEFVIRLAKRANSLTLGPLHPSFHVVGTVRRSFEKSLPDNAHEIASGRLHISLTRVSDLSNVIISEYKSKEDLIEALVATSYVPFYSGFLPAKFRGKYYVDGGISDNLPQHFKEGETITVSPFSGESDICPKDGSSNDAHLCWKNTSLQFTLQNLYRCSRAFFPPRTDVLFSMCRQGYRDTLRFLKNHYPETLRKGIKKRSISAYLPAFSSKSSSTRVERLASSSSVTSAYSTCSNGEEVFSSEDNEEPSTEGSEGQEQQEEEIEEEEGESKLAIFLHRTSEAVTEAELWSCYFIRRVFWFFQLAARPCVISIKQFTLMGKIILESLPKVENTGNEFLDHLLAMIYMIVHTYQDKHQVQIWTKSRLAITDLEGKVESVFNSVADWKNDSMVNSYCLVTHEDTFSSSCFTEAEQTSISVIRGSNDDDSEIEVLRDHDSVSMPLLDKIAIKGRGDMSSSVLSESAFEDQSDDEGLNSIYGSLERWDHEGGACTKVPLPVSSGDDYVVLDGYDSDVESELSAYDEVQEGF